MNQLFPVTVFILDPQTVTKIFEIFCKVNINPLVYYKKEQPVGGVTMATTPWS